MDFLLNHQELVGCFRWSALPPGCGALTRGALKKTETAKYDGKIRKKSLPVILNWGIFVLIPITRETGSLVGLNLPLVG
jgi:hypothetical protein